MGYLSQEKILFLGPKDSPLISWLKYHGEEEVIQTDDKISIQFVNENKFTFLVCYGYRYILPKEILDKFLSKAINLHISYLPWNRGADPNFWSFAEDTPKGVTIHYLDEGEDTGDIIVQKEVSFDSEKDTFTTSYRKLSVAIQDLFKKNWCNIKEGTCHRQKQAGKGSTHKLEDKKRISHLLTNEWDTPVSALDEYVAEIQISKQFWHIYDSEIKEQK